MKYSFLMSVYYKEKPKYLQLSIDSMINQTVKPDEIIIVKDGKLTKELNSVIDNYYNKNKKLFTIVELKENVGLGLALNEGIKKSRNQLIARMDSDDICKPNRCEKQLKKIKDNPELSIVGAWVDEFFDDPQIINSTRTVPCRYEEIYEFAKKRSAFNHPVVMYKKASVLENGGYSDLRRNQDVDLFGRMLYSGCKAENLNESLLWFRSNNDLAKRRKSWENTKSYINTIKRFWMMGYSSFSDYLIVAVAQVAMFLLPVKMQHWVYKNFLRK